MRCLAFDYEHKGKTYHFKTLKEAIETLHLDSRTIKQKWKNPREYKIQPKNNQRIIIPNENKEKIIEKELTEAQKRAKERAKKEAKRRKEISMRLAKDRENKRLRMLESDEAWFDSL